MAQLVLSKLELKISTYVFFTAKLFLQITHNTLLYYENLLYKGAQQADFGEINFFKLR